MASYLNQNTQSMFAGLSTDRKPMDVQNGSIFHEIDTAQDWRYDAKKEKWEKQKSNRWWMAEW